MKKNFKFVALLLVACMTFMLAGCDLFPRNNASYLNQTVITVNYNDGNKIEISRREYQNAYNNYGASLISSNGYTEEQAKEATVNALVNRKVLLTEAKSNTTIANKVIAKDSEILYQTYKALISNANEYETAIREDWNMPLANEMSEESASGTVYTPYEKKAQVVLVKNDNEYEYKIKKLENNETAPRDFVFATIQQVKNRFLNETKNNEESSILREEYVRYLATLRSSQVALGTNYTDDKLIENEVRRIYDNLVDNEYISQYEELFSSNGDYSNVTVDQVLRKYKSMISISNFKYTNDADKFNSDMLENFKDVDYYVNDNYFYVAHILIKFNDEEQAKYDSLKTASNNGQGGTVSAEAYKTEKAKIYNNLKATVTNIETGEVVSSHSVLANDVLLEVQTALASATTNEQKDEAFRKLMYKYNEDGGIMNADYPYIIGTNDSKMVENFTNASRELNEAGEYGAISGLVESEYGLHIIYYMGKCTNPFTFGDNGNVTLRAYYEEEETKNGNTVITRGSDVIKLCETKLNNLNNKTLFDLVYEKLESDTYSKFENINIETLKNHYGIKVVTKDI